MVIGTPSSVEVTSIGTIFDTLTVLVVWVGSAAGWILRGARSSGETLFCVEFLVLFFRDFIVLYDETGDGDEKRGTLLSS